MPRPLRNEPIAGDAVEPRAEPDDPDRPLRGPAWARAQIEEPAREHDDDEDRKDPSGATTTDDADVELGEP